MWKVSISLAKHWVESSLPRVSAVRSVAEPLLAVERVPIAAKSVPIAANSVLVGQSLPPTPNTHLFRGMMSTLYQKKEVFTMENQVFPKIPAEKAGVWSRG